MGARSGAEFELTSPLPPEVVEEALSAQLRSDACPISGIVAEGRIEIHVPSGRQHLWSPQLTVDLEKTDSGCRLSGRFVQHPHVFGLCMLGGSALAVLLLVAFSVSYGQWVMGQTPTALLAFPVAGSLVLVVFCGFRLGAERSADQKRELSDYVRSSLPPGPP